MKSAYKMAFDKVYNVVNACSSSSPQFSGFLEEGLDS